MIERERGDIREIDVRLQGTTISEALIAHLQMEKRINGGGRFRLPWQKPQPVIPPFQVPRAPTGDELHFDSVDDTTSYLDPQNSLHYLCVGVDSRDSYIVKDGEVLLKVPYPVDVVTVNRDLESAILAVHQGVENPKLSGIYILRGKEVKKVVEATAGMETVWPMKYLESDRYTTRLSTPYNLIVQTQDEGGKSSVVAVNTAGANADTWIEGADAIRCLTVPAYEQTMLFAEVSGESTTLRQFEIGNNQTGGFEVNKRLNLKSIRLENENEEDIEPDLSNLVWSAQHEDSEDEIDVYKRDEFLTTTKKTSEVCDRIDDKGEMHVLVMPMGGESISNLTVDGLIPESEATDPADFVLGDSWDFNRILIAAEVREKGKTSGARVLLIRENGGFLSEPFDSISAIQSAETDDGEQIMTVYAKKDGVDRLVRYSVGDNQVQEVPQQAA